MWLVFRSALCSEHSGVEVCLGDGVLGIVFVLLPERDSFGSADGYLADSVLGIGRGGGFFGGAQVIEVSGDIEFPLDSEDAQRYLDFFILLLLVERHGAAFQGCFLEVSIILFGPLR